MQNNRAYLLLGSNINKEKNIQKAIQELSATFKITKQSSNHTSAAIGPDGLECNDPPFLNCALEIHTTKTLKEVKEILLQIELNLGRVRTKNKFAPRLIDIDIVKFNDDILDPEIHTAPHIKTVLSEILIYHSNVPV